jgi:hypothetical protein
MLIIGCGFRTRFQQIAMADPRTCELNERGLEPGNEEIPVEMGISAIMQMNLM